MKLFLSLALSAVAACAQGTISIVAGNGSIAQVTGDNGPATSAGLGFPSGIAADGFGNVFVADTLTKRVRKVTATSGVISAYAGGGVPGNIAEGLAATAAGFTFPANSHIGLATDTAGNLYIADSGTNRVRKVSTSGVITTVAGAGSLTDRDPAFGGDGGPATAARLLAPSGVAVDKDGNVYIADTGNGRIRKVDPIGTITTVAGRGNGTSPGDNGPALNAQLSNPSDVAVDSAGNIYIADFGNNAVRKVTAATGVITTILRGGFGGCPTTAVAASRADIRAASIAIDGTNNLFIGNVSADCVLMMEPNGTVSTVAGNGNQTRPDNIPATNALLGNIWAVNADARGNLYLTNSLGYANKVTPRTIPPSTLPIVTAVVNGATFYAGAAPNTWITIRGTNLSSQTDTWDKAIIPPGLLPTTLDNITVTIAGRPVYVQYISPTQINVLTPPDLATGIQPVVVTTPAGPSTPFSVVVLDSMPAFFTWPGDQPVATHMDFSLAARAGTFSGATTIPAKPGEVIILWGTGMGPTSPAAPAGVQVSGAYSTASLPLLSLRLIPVTVYGAALAPGFAGLYQLAFQVPVDFADGDYPITGTVAGIPFGNAINLAVKK